MNKNANVLIAALYLREASELLKYELSDVSTSLLELVKLMLEKYQIDNNDLQAAQNVVDNIRNDSNG